MIFLARKYKQKPRQWGPPSVVSRAILENSARVGLPPPSLALPLWEGIGDDPLSYGPYGWDEAIAFYGRATALNASWRSGPVLDISGSTGALYGAPKDALGYTKGAFFSRVKGSGTPASIGKFFTISDYAGEGAAQLNRQSDTTYRVNFNGVSHDFTGVPDIWGSNQWHDVCLSWVSASWLKLWVDAYASLNSSWGGTPAAITSYVIFGNRGMTLDRPIGCQFDVVLLFQDALNDTQVDRLQQDIYSIFAPTPQRTIFDMARGPAGGDVDLITSMPDATGSASDLSVTRDANAPIGAIGDVFAGITVQRHLLTDVGAQTLASAALARALGLSADVGAQTLASAALARAFGLSADVGAQTLASAALALAFGLSASCDAVDIIDAAVAVSRTLAGAAADVSAISADLVTAAANYIELVSQMNAVGWVSPGLSSTRMFSAESADYGSLSAGMSRYRSLEAGLGASCDTDAAINRYAGCSAVVDSAADVAGVLGVIRSMHASVSSIGNILVALATADSAYERIALHSDLTRQINILSGLTRRIDILSGLTRRIDVDSVLY